MTLDDALPGRSVVLAAPVGDAGRRRRLAELGLRGGERARVLHRVAGGGLLVDVDGARIVLDRVVLRCLPLVGQTDRSAASAASAVPETSAVTVGNGARG